MKTLKKTALLILSVVHIQASAVTFTEPEEVEVKEVSEPRVEPSTEQNQERRQRRSGRVSPETNITPLSQRTTLRDIYQSQEFESTFEMRARRRVGIGAQTAGTTGLVGALVELNLTPSSSAIAAFGGGPGFNAFNFQYKNVFGGRNFAPYAGVGYARWYNASGTKKELGQTTPGFLGSRFLTADEKRSGEFAIDLITPNIGIQYIQLSGPYTGTSVFAEITFLGMIREFSPVPTGSIGALYYF